MSDGKIISAGVLRSRGRTVEIGRHRRTPVESGRDRPLRVETRPHGRTTTVCSGRQETMTGSPCAMGAASRFCSSTVTSTPSQATR